ncbi:hypothetical protein RN001_006440 [Aquatica leii]|uniref:Uncharacterized protein n=1 Tax=Aquatica leii TaxID=1421715 RepID=A0AAN7PIK5_9COLE|nr:hypothetical protein RN001_006440 [Aquatica leii]
MQEYCRLCQENLGTINIVDNDEFISKVFQCSNIKINDEQMQVFPKSVCNRCHLNIEEIFNFIKQIQLTNRRLYDHFIYPEKLQSTTDKVSAFHNKANDLETHSDTSNDETTFNDDIAHKYLEVQYDNSVEDEDSSNICDKVEIRNNVEDSVVDNSVNFQISLSDEDNSTSESLDNDFDEKELKKAKCRNLFPCTYDNCSKVYTSSYSFRTHLMKHEGTTPFLCVTCGKGFTTKNSLNCHEKIHAKVKAYVCTECNIRFSVSSNLRAHQKKHHEGIRYYCSQCPLVYISKSSLERHEMVHTGIKEYKCGMCKAAFYTNKELKKHERYHQGLRLYKCEECFKTFFEKHHLTIHIRGHTGERPYKCKIAGCGKSFTESQKLTRHLKARHPLI